MWEELVRERGGVPVGSVDDAAVVDLKAMAFVVVECRDDDLLPAVAKLEPAQAVAFMLLGEGGSASGERAVQALDALQGGRDAYLLKQGRVGGSDPDRSIEIRADHVVAILDGIAAASIDWERDPDFGYEVAAMVPGIDGSDRFILIPRFLYARTERVYAHAARVPELKRERAETLRAIDGLDPRIVEAVA
jgi:phosphoenolpyruvate carboxykinase (ATP)